MASPHKTKRRNKSSINYPLTPPNTQSFKPDKFELKRGAKSENKSSDSHRVTTSQLATTLAGIWSYIGQPAVLKPDENLNFEIYQNGNSVHCTSEISTHEDLKAMKKRLLFSYYKLASVDILRDKGEYRECQTRYMRAIYEPKYLVNTRNLCYEKSPNYTVRTTEDPPCRDNLEPMQEAVSRKEEEVEVMVFLESRASSDQESENKIELLTPSACVNTQKELSESSASLVSKSSVDKLIEGRSDSLQEKLAEHGCSIDERVRSGINVNRDALSGAMAGTMVSLFLHPVDTVKTIVQSSGTGRYSFYPVLGQTLTERGLLGLYRGIASKIASSAPISAIYTFTYESVKGTLLPIFPKEYQSVTHCIAGGCSSVATSFVFTPSERIKQQMQVGTQYQNCWNALVGCIEKGGVATLYAGWRAVLCRNIPHSIIKFYTYERLKQHVLEGRPDSTLSSWQTLACGGMAGSTAALFSTPFDVVKTRIQTQAPGAARKYNGVLQALKEIMKKEGLPGLYRGLTPRLGMYVSQGSIFFASYEFLKALFALDVEKHTSKPERDGNPPMRNS